MLSQKTKYALKALLALAEAPAGETLMIGDIADQERIPRKFLELILVDLKRLGFVYSRRGRTGGYALAKTPAEISFGQVVRQMEGPLALLPCVSKTAYRPCDDCVDEDACQIHDLLAEVREATAKLMDSRSLQDALRSKRLKRRKAAG